jgi:hypothetical protein
MDGVFFVCGEFFSKWHKKFIVAKFGKQIHFFKNHQIHQKSPNR